MGMHLNTTDAVVLRWGQPNQSAMRRIAKREKKKKKKKQNERARKTSDIWRMFLTRESALALSLSFSLYSGLIFLLHHQPHELPNLYASVRHMHVLSFMLADLYGDSGERKTLSRIYFPA